MPAASDCASALDRTGFMNPLIIGTMLMGGAALLFERSAPVGLILLGPSIAVIAGFHWFLTGKLVWGSIWPVWFLLLVWHHLDVFSRLWVPRSEEHTSELQSLMRLSSAVFCLKKQPTLIVHH